MRKLSLAMMGIATAALMTMVSCRKPNSGNIPGAPRTVTFTATTESNDGSKTSVSGHDILWKIGDAISINGVTFTLDPNADGQTSGTFTGIISSGTPYYVGYPAINTTYDSQNNTLKLGIPSTQTYDKDRVVVPMVAYSATENLQFSNAVNVLKIDLNGDNTTASKLTNIVLSHATANLSGDITVTFDDGGVPNFSYATGSKHATVNFSGEDGQLTQETKSVYIVLPKIASGDIKITFFCANGKCMEKTINSEGFDNVNKLISGPTLEVNATTVPLFVPGDFTVSAGADGVAGTTDDVKVLFSRGNLYWDGTESVEADRWKLEANQWDYRTWVGKNSCIGGTVSETGTPTNHCGLFKWSKAEIAVTDEDYIDGDLFCISKFTVEGETWFTLSGDEWGNLLGITGAPSPRDNASSLWGWSTVAGVNGLVILPDGSNASLSSITTAADLAAARAVFLPALGYRASSAVSIGMIGCYWSSIPNGMSGAYSMSFKSDEVTMFSIGRYYGCCVRLVR